MNKEIEIYIPLLNEETPVIRGTMAIDLGNNIYRVLPTPFYDPTDETWQFLPGSVVKCEKTENYKGQMILLATEEIKDF